jgi:hypothetical protein
MGKVLYTLSDGVQVEVAPPDESLEKRLAASEKQKAQNHKRKNQKKSVSGKEK